MKIQSFGAMAVDWEARIDVEEGIASTVRWLRSRAEHANGGLPSGAAASGPAPRRPVVK